MVDELHALQTLHALQRGTAVEGALVDALQGGGQNHSLQSRQIGEGVGADGLHALGDDDLLHGVVTDEPDLGGLGRILGDLVVFILGDVIEVGEGVLSDLGEGQGRGDVDHAAQTEVVGQGGACGHVGILDGDADGLGEIGGIIIHEHLHGDGGKALGHGGDLTRFVHGHDLIVGGLEHHLGIRGEVGIQAVAQGRGLGGVHGEIQALTPELHLISLHTQQAILGGEEVVGLIHAVARQSEVLGHGLVVTDIALIPLAANGQGEGGGLLGHGIAGHDTGHAGGDGHQLVVHHGSHVHVGGVVLQKLGPLGGGIHHGLEIKDLVGRQGQLALGEVEIGVVVGQGDLVGRLVQRVIVGDHGEAVAVDGAGTDLVDVVGQLVDDGGGGVLLGVDGSQVLVKGLDHVSVALQGHVTDLHAHGVVVIVDSHLGVETGLLGGLIVLGVELAVCDGGSLKVGDYGEGKGVVIVGIRAVPIVVHVGLDGDGVGGIVLQILLDGGELDVDVGGVNGGAVGVGLADVGIHGLVDHLARRIVGDGNDGLLHVTEKSRPHVLNGIDRAVLVGDGYVLAVGGDLLGGGILHEVVRAHVAHVIALHAADGTGGVGIGQGLIQQVDGVVQLVLVGLVEVQIHDGSLGPVAVEGQEGSVQIDGGSLLSGEGHKALHVHTVLEGIVQILLVGIAQGNGHGDLGYLAAGHGDGTAVLGTAADGGDRNGRAAQNVALLGDGGLTLLGLGVADTLGHDQSGHVVGQGGRAEVVDGELQGVHTGAGGIVAQLDLGLVHDLTRLAVVGLNEGLGGGGVVQIGQTRALLTGGVGEAVGVVHHVGGGHEELVDEGGHGHGIVSLVGEVGLDVLAEQSGHTRHIGGCHGGTRNAVVGLTGHSRQDGAAVGGDLGLQLEIGGGAPGREVGHEGAGGLGALDGELTRTGGGQHLTVVLTDGGHGDGGVAHVHLDVTRHVVVDDDTGGTLLLSHVGLLLEGGGATGDQCDLARHVDTGVVGGATRAGDGDELDLHLVHAVGKNIVVEVLLLGNAVGGLQEVDDGLTEEQVGSLDTADGGDGQSTLVGGGRADGSRVGVGGQTQVTVLLGGVGGVVAVGGGGHDGDTGGADAVVHTRNGFLVHLAGEAAVGTQGHVDDVHAQHHAVVQSRQDPGGSRGGLHVGEGLHDDQLGVGGNACDGSVLTRNDTGHVSTVIRGDGVHVGVGVGVVKAEGHLLVDVHVGGGQTRLHTRGAGVAHQSGHLLEGQTQLISVRGEVLQREGGVVVVQTRIQNRHHRAGTVVGKAGAVEDTRLVDVHGILHQLSGVAQRSGLLGLVDLTDDGGASVAHGLGDGLEVTGLDDQLEAAENVGIVLAQIVLELGLVQVGQQSLLLGGNAVADGGGLLRESVLGKAHARGCPGVLIQQRLFLDLNDDGDLVRLLDGIGQLVEHRAVVVILFVGDELTVEGSDPSVRRGTAGDHPGDHRGGGRQRQNSGQNHRQNTDPSL